MTEKSLGEGGMTDMYYISLTCPGLEHVPWAQPVAQIANTTRSELMTHEDSPTKATAVAFQTMTIKGFPTQRPTSCAARAGPSRTAVVLAANHLRGGTDSPPKNSHTSTA